MALTDILMERVARRGRTAQIACHALGIMTVEALPAGELTALLRGADGRRAVVYSACRELQTAGEALRKAGRLFQPDEIMTFLAEDEVQTAFQAVLDLSGTASGQQSAPQAGQAADASEGSVQEASSPKQALLREELPPRGGAPLAAEQPQQGAVPGGSNPVLDGVAAESAVVQVPLTASSGAAALRAEPLSVRELPELDNEGFSARQAAVEVQNESLAPQPVPSRSPKGAVLDEAALTERVARRILTGLRQAAAVR